MPGNHSRYLLLIFFLSWLPAALHAQTDLQISVDTTQNSESFGRISVTGVDRATLQKLRQIHSAYEHWQRMFSVKLHSPSTMTKVAELPNVAGQYEYIETGFQFAPKFRPSCGLTYHISVSVDGCKPATAQISIADGPSMSIDRPKIKAYYPSSDSVPENVLRLYIHFSKPMARGQVAQHIRLLDEDNDLIPHAFIVGPLGELWDKEQKRLTLLLDPGRIKRGVGPNRRLGPALKARAALPPSPDGQFKDAKGRCLGAETRKTYTVEPAVRDSVQPQLWTTSAPRSGSREAVNIRFKRSLDHGMLGHSITVHGGNGERIKGLVSVGAGEESWRFTPATPWKQPAYTIRVADRLEDISGNSVRTPLDVELESTNMPDVRWFAESHLRLQFTPVARSDRRNN